MLRLQHSRQRARPKPPASARPQPYKLTVLIDLSLLRLSLANFGPWLGGSWSCRAIQF